MRHNLLLRFKTLQGIVKLLSWPPLLLCWRRRLVQRRLLDVVSCDSLTEQRTPSSKLMDRCNVAYRYSPPLNEPSQCCRNWFYIGPGVTPNRALQWNMTTLTDIKPKNGSLSGVKKQEELKGKNSHVPKQLSYWTATVFVYCRLDAFKPLSKPWSMPTNLATQSR